jgi:L-methionine (R)-S-oxide reductase
MIYNKKDKYRQLFPQIKALITKDRFISNLSTFAAFIYHEFSFFWVGFYLLDKNELVVGPYQGPIACLTLPYNKGVCWKAVLNQKSIIVPNVDECEGHISCNPLSKSEIVVPLYDIDNNITGVLDIDSNEYNAFDETDRIYLEKYVDLIRRSPGHLF